ncbi:transglutaminase family protein [Rhodoblastus acidophilus]|uniref:Transglutaminase family protein n=1 Tax=Candidatus Rhodoblastus alkanivorans TaxID=2954117 RepID=A0ABS9Z4Q2_9HYPH|nr:transglutaminase family protein [Candidatus Rhodoblastus alkanivorans]MCI4677659.1 transglutaminase family protein [Candidatus Rhodoblastus alkanivorans]MCI4682609.1 transglutaminase family protein [Candidatus Rhodoblastus alkanivorans]MDI4639915.1 transglutaminase family protein [Rhodoblastus acidophilus]
MRASVQFQLQITYAEPVRALNQVFRLKPRSYDTQDIRDWVVDVQPDATLRRSKDAFGNVVHSCSHNGPLDRLTVTAEGLVETYDAAGVVRGLVERLPLDVFRRDTAATHADKQLTAFAIDALAHETDPLGQMHLLMGELHKTLAFAPGETDWPRPAAEVFAARAGSARELAQVFVAAARSLDVPARFISGLFLGADGADGAGAYHAWAEVHVEPIGWISFDPALGFCPRDEHLRVAQGLDFSGAAPRRAACFNSAPEEAIATLTVDIGRQASWQIQQ